MEPYDNGKYNMDKSVGGLVSLEDGNLNNCERIGVVVLVQILSRYFNNRLCHGLATNAEKASIVRQENRSSSC